LELIFNHPKYAEGLFKYPAYFWIPLIGLFTGMRLEEIAQLHTEDIKAKDGVWIIDVNEKGIDEKGFTKTLKNKNATRIIPVHNTLIFIGLIEFKDSMKEKNSVRLFPELNKTDKTGKFGKQPGKQFSALIKVALNSKNSTYEKKSFHSLRHTFNDFFKQNNLIDDVYNQLFGHEIQTLAKKRYGTEYSVENLKNLIQKLNYEVDFSHLKDNKYTNFDK
jgi:integrase